MCIVHALPGAFRGSCQCPVPVPVLLGTAVLVWTDRLGEGRVANVVEPDDIAGGAGVLVGAELVDCTNVGV